MHKDGDVQRLSYINEVLKDILKTMVSCRKFTDFASNLLTLSQRLLPVELLEFFVLLENKQVLHLTPLTRYRGDVIPSPVFCEEIWSLNQKEQDKNYLELSNDNTEEILKYFLSQVYNCANIKK